MKKGYVMALDVGGGSGCCLLLDPDSGRVWTAQQTWTHPDALSSFSWTGPRKTPDEKTKEKLSKNKRPTVTS